MSKRSKKNAVRDPYRALSSEQKIKNVIEAADNPYTEKLSDDCTRIYYTGEFYLKMNELLESGMTAVQAYEACGYKTAKLGKLRAEAAANKAKEFKAGNKHLDWRSYSGMESLEEILKEKDPAVREAQLIAKIQVMEAMDEAQKKILPELLEMYTPSNRTKKK